MLFEHWETFNVFYLAFADVGLFVDFGGHLVLLEIYRVFFLELWLHLVILLSWLQIAVDNLFDYARLGGDLQALGDFRLNEV